MSTGVYYYMLDEENLNNVKQDLQRHLEVEPSSSLVNDESYSTNISESADESSFSN